jgi:hypothetical protein
LAQSVLFRPKVGNPTNEHFPARFLGPQLRTDWNAGLLSPRSGGFMRPNILGDLLTTLDVRLHAFGVCEIQMALTCRSTPWTAVLRPLRPGGPGVPASAGRRPVSSGR